MVVLRHLGRGHTDHDVVAHVPDTGVVFAGDLVEQGAPPGFEDSYPLDWPATLGLAARPRRRRRDSRATASRSASDFVEGQLAEIAFLAETARRSWPELRDAGHDPHGHAPHPLVEETAAPPRLADRAGPRGPRPRPRPGGRPDLGSSPRERGQRREQAVDLRGRRVVDQARAGRPRRSGQGPGPRSASSRRSRRPRRRCRVRAERLGSRARRPARRASPRRSGSARRPARGRPGHGPAGPGSREAGEEPARQLALVASRSPACRRPAARARPCPGGARAPKRSPTPARYSTAASVPAIPSWFWVPVSQRSSAGRTL